MVSGFVYIIYKGKGFERNNSLKSQNGIINQILKKERLKRKQQEIDKRIEAKKVMDKLLEKIAKEGMSSLSAKDKRNLEWARKHYYPHDSDVVH